ncbi:CDP-alcohol phosphatidyltransferase family protein [Candidatus Kaiserbacteria bacterium]|nr:CDP-alcohol phosphatidyltransferase family protein [Candidatus Kaiserbacteria bacterium]
MSALNGSATASGGAKVSNARKLGYLIPNTITAGRLVCAAGLFVYSDAATAFYLALTGAVSDYVDGFIAKTWNLGTAFGKRFDQWTDLALGIAIMYAILHREDFTANNFPLTLLIGGYLGARTLMPTVDTNGYARTKTGMQFGGGVAILGSYAFTWAAEWHVWHVAYAVVWVSIIWMWWSLRDYLRMAWWLRSGP